MGAVFGTVREAVGAVLGAVFIVVGAVFPTVGAVLCMKDVLFLPSRRITL